MHYFEFCFCLHFLQYPYVYQLILRKKKWNVDVNLNNLNRINRHKILVFELYCIIVKQLDVVYYQKRNSLKSAASYILHFYHDTFLLAILNRFWQNLIMKKLRSSASHAQNLNAKKTLYLILIFLMI